MTEIWASVPGYEGLYEVSNIGRVRSLPRSIKCGSGSRTIPGVLRRQSIASSGYQVVSLSKECVIRTACIHVLVLTAFVGPRPDGMHACHSDGDRLNNRLDNLRWDTIRENALDRLRHGTLICGSKQKGAILDELKVAEIKRRLRSGERQTVLANEYGVALETIHSIKSGKSWRHVHA